MNAPKIPISQLLTDKSDVSSEEPKKKTRDEWRKAKELEEARKAGQVAAAVDEEGKLLIDILIKTDPETFFFTKTLIIFFK